MASAQEIRLSPTMYMEVSEKEIRFSRKRGLFFRMVIIPRHLFQLSTSYDSAFSNITVDGEERVLATREEWQLSVVCFKGKKYMAYTRLNQKGERVG